MATVYDAQIARVGRVEESGIISSVAGAAVGVVAADGLVFAAGSPPQVFGLVDGQRGHLYDAAGHLVGHVASDSDVFDQLDQYAGYVATWGRGTMLHSGGAALLLLLPGGCARPHLSHPLRSPTTRQLQAERAGAWTASTVCPADRAATHGTVACPSYGTVAFFC